MSTRLLWCCAPILLALAANAFFGQPREPARLTTAVLITLVLLSATMIAPILIDNARLSRAAADVTALRWSGRGSRRRSAAGASPGGSELGRGPRQ